MDHSQKAVSVFDKRAEDYQAKFMDVALYHDTLDLFLGALQPGASVLELACGPGNITKYLLGRRPDLKILGTDLSPKMIALAKTNNPEADFMLLDVREAAMLGKKSDAAICGFGLPYLSREEAVQWIADVAGMLHPKGVLYLSTMEDDYSRSGPKKSSDGKDEIFMHFHEAGYLCEALKSNGFEILTLKRQNYPGPDGSKTTDLIIIARHGS